MTETLDEQCKRCWKEGQELISELAKDPDNNLFSNGLNIGRKIKEVEDRVSDKYAAMKETITALEMQNTELQERISTLETAAIKVQDWWVETGHKSFDGGAPEAIFAIRSALEAKP